jgi:hypothetical protein
MRVKDRRLTFKSHVVCAVADSSRATERAASARFAISSRNNADDLTDSIIPVPEEVID